MQTASFGPHALRVSLAASVPLLARLRVTPLLCPGDGFVTGSLTLGSTTVSALANCTAATAEVPIALDPSGVTLTLVTSGGDLLGWPYFQPTTSQWTIEVLPDPNFPCSVVPYGNGCGGATLIATTSFTTPGAHLLTLRDPGTVVAAMLGFGTQRTSVPLPSNCTILNNLAIVVPAPVANGEATFTITPPALPGLVFQVQGGVAPASGGLHLSNALELACR